MTSKKFKIKRCTMDVERISIPVNAFLVWTKLWSSTVGTQILGPTLA